MEIEAKFTVEDQEIFEAIENAGTLAGLQLRPGDESRLLDTYFDTAEGLLFSQGYALRERCGGPGVLITLKSLPADETHILHREEIETLLETGDTITDLKSGAVRKKLDELVGEVPLMSLFELEQDRRTRLLKDGRRIIAEICFDRVSLPGKDGKKRAFLELEVELRKGGKEEELEEILKTLQDEWRLAPQNRSKFIRALEHTGHKFALGSRIDPAEMRVKPPKDPGIQSDDSMVTAAQKTLSLHFRHMCYHEPGTRLGEDIEALHDMRVATRRMRAAFQIFTGYLPSKAAKPLLKQLKRTGRALGVVRDLDVFWGKTGQYLESLPANDSVDLSALRMAWEQEQNKARKQLNSYLDSSHYRQFAESFQAFLDQRDLWYLPVFGPDSTPRPHLLQHVVPIAVYQGLAEILAYDQWVTGQSVPVERLHELRIAAKRLRYTLEFFREILGPEVELIIKRIKGLQDHLGDLQDAVVARDILESFLLWGTWGEEKPRSGGLAHQPVLFRDAGVSTYLSARQREIDILLETFPQAWVEIRDPYFAHSIAAMLTGW